MNIKEVLKKHEMWLNGEDGGEKAALHSANLRYANLHSADLRYADLRYADLRSADLRYADLRYANLHSADLHSADLRSANLKDVDSTNALMYNLQCPEEGSFIGWKKCKNDVIVKLRITADSFRSSATSRKCRASKVKVLDIIGADKAYSKFYDSFCYEKGKVIEIETFDKNRWEECAAGIHFFITRKEAEEY